MAVTISMVGKSSRKKCLYIFGECITKDLNFTDLEIQSF